MLAISIISDNINVMDKMINDLGKKFKGSEQYFYVNTFTKDINGKKTRFIVVKNIHNERMVSRIDCLKSGSNPFNRKTFTPRKEIMDTIKKCNKDAEYGGKFVFYGFAKRDNQNHLMIKVKRCSTKEIVKIRYSDLKRNRIPFRSNLDLHEKKVVQPFILKYLKRLGKVESEVCLSRRSRIDFVLTIKNKKFLIEAKSDKKIHSTHDLKNQIKKYITDGKKKYGKDYCSTLLVSLKGKYGININELKSHIYKSI